MHKQKTRVRVNITYEQFECVVPHEYSKGHMKHMKHTKHAKTNKKSASKMNEWVLNIAAAV